MAISANDLDNLETNINGADSWVGGGSTGRAANGRIFDSIAKINAQATSDFNQHLAALGFEPPIAFTSSILVDRTTLTVEESNNVFAPLVSEIPFTTTGLFDASQWYLITDQLPSQATNAGKVLTTDATTATWTANYVAARATTVSMIAASNLPLNSLVRSEGYTTSNDGGSAPWKHNGVTGQTISQSPIQLNAPLFNDVNGDQFAMFGDAEHTFDTFANFEASGIGNIGQRFIVLDRANAVYITQPSTYTKLDGDATLASGLDAELQLPEGKCFVDWFGAKGDKTQNDAPFIEDAAKRAITLGDTITTGSTFAATAHASVRFRDGGVYKHDAAFTLDNEGRNVDWYCDGRAVIFSTGRTHGFAIFERLHQNHFTNLTFAGFDTAVTFDTNNVDAAIINFDQCEWIDCDIAVDTVSFALSRSTVLNFNQCRCAEVDRLTNSFNSFCDVTSFNECHFRNGVDGQAFILVDSKVTVNGGIWTPYFTGADTRWFDIFDSDGSTRGITFNGPRFGKEAGGVPMVYNFIDAKKDATSRQTDSINFIGGLYGSSGASTLQGVVVLTESSGESLAPSSINFYGADWNAANGLVITESGSPVSAIVGIFNITADESTQGRLGSSISTPPSPIVEAQLLQYLKGRTYDIRDETTTGTFTLDAGKERNVRLASASSATIDGLTTNVMDGTIIYFRARNANTTFEDFSSGSNIQLAGSADYNILSNSSLTLQWDRPTSRWVELSRSVN